MTLCILFIVIGPHSAFTSTTAGSASSGIVMTFAAQIVSFSFRSFISTSYENINVTLASVPALNIAGGAECSQFIFDSLGDISRIHLSAHAVLSETFLSRFGRLSTTFEPACLPSVQQEGLYF